MLCAMYREYLERRRMEVPRDDAGIFGGAELLQAELFPAWPTHDIDSVARELAASGFLSARFADNQLDSCALTQDAIVHMEHRFQGNLAKVLGAIAKLRPIVFPD